MVGTVEKARNISQEGKADENATRSFQGPFPELSTIRLPKMTGFILTGDPGIGKLCGYLFYPFGLVP